MPAGAPGSSGWGSDRRASGPSSRRRPNSGAGSCSPWVFLTPLAAAALIAQSVVIVGLVHLPKGFWNRNGGVEFPLSLAAGVVALAGTGSGSASLDAALGLSYSAEVRGLLIAVGIFGALVALAISRVRPEEPTAAAGPG
jgi:hypothetical protein